MWHKRGETEWRGTQSIAAGLKRKEELGAKEGRYRLKGHPTDSQ